jgi:AGZA family xanthine/uracil permease-like MFS transporter
VTLGVCAVLSLFGVIHSIAPSGSVYLPWEVGSRLPWQWAVAYAAVAVLISSLDGTRRLVIPPPTRE